MRFRLLFFFCFFLFFLSNSYAYIDPGTGGYLLSSLWATLVGFLAIVFGVILRFFRHTLKNFIVSNWKRRRVLFVLVCLLILVGIVFSCFYFLGSGQEHLVRSYDADKVGVVLHDEDKAYDGYNLYHGKLLDMEGNLVNSWNYSYLSVIDDEGFYYAQRGYETLEFGKFDWNDNAIWIKEVPIHHEIYLNGNSLYVFTKETYEYNGRLVEFDVILELNKTDGEEISRWSTYDDLTKLKQYHRPLELDEEKSFFVPEDHRKNTSIWGANYDYYHLNSFSLVPKNSMEGAHPAFNEGNWIISFRHGSMIFILDKDTKEVLWRAIYDQIEDNLEGQHAPLMLESGNIVVFDNGRYREWSRIVEINPVSLEVVSEYKPDWFFTYSQGYFQVFDNENMLITESEQGHVFELDTDENIVWEFYEPKSKKHDEYGLIREDIYRMTRYDKGLIESFIRRDD